MERALYLVRHGHIDHGDERRYIGVTDLPLSPRGIDDALRVGEQLKKITFSHIYCSDLLRAIQTADIIGGNCRLSTQIRPELREMALGTWENRSFREISQEFPEEYLTRGQNIATYRTPQGESFTDCYNRVVPFFQNVIARLSGNILLVAHAGVNRTILSHVLGLPLDQVMQIRQDYGCIYRIRWDNSGYRIETL